MTLTLLTIISLLLLDSTVLGHAPLDYATMKPRREASGVKTTIANIDTARCGSQAVDNTPGEVKHFIEPGSQFEVVWIETIDHPSKYLIDITSEDPVNAPLSAAEPRQIVLHDADLFYDDTLLPQDMDAKIDRVSPGSQVVNPNADAVYRVMVDIPADVNCEKCTLRLMQKMYDMRNLRQTVYTHCTDVQIKVGASANETLVIPQAPTNIKIKLNSAD